jgi:hypothetical protein
MYLLYLVASVTVMCLLSGKMRLASAPIEIELEPFEETDSDNAADFVLLP